MGEFQKHFSRQLFSIIFRPKRVWSSWPQLGGLGRFLGSQWDRQLNFFFRICFFFDFVKPLKIWAYLDNFFFKGKMLKIPMYSYGNFSAFFLWSPLGNYEKKSCLNKLKFGEASRNKKRSICWTFKLSISLGTQKSAKTPPAVGKMIRPFH